MLRKLLIAFFIFTSLSVQARTLFACSMAGVLSEEAHCADVADPDAPADEDACCFEVTLVGAEGPAVDGTPPAGARLALDAQEVPLLVTMLAVLQPEPEPGGAAPPPLTTDPVGAGTRTFLHTRRLRI